MTLSIFQHLWIDTNPKIIVLPKLNFVLTRTTNVNLGHWHKELHTL